MANPFDMLSQLQAFRDQSAALLSETEPDWFMRAAAARMLEWVLQSALDAGPPASFAEGLGVDDSQARVLYSTVLRAAMHRQRELVHGR